MFITTAEKDFIKDLLIGVRNLEYFPKKLSYLDALNIKVICIKNNINIDTLLTKLLQDYSKNLNNNMNESAALYGLIIFFIADLKAIQNQLSHFSYLFCLSDIVDQFVTQLSELCTKKPWVKYPNYPKIAFIRRMLDTRILKQNYRTINNQTNKNTFTILSLDIPISNENSSKEVTLLDTLAAPVDLKKTDDLSFNLVNNLIANSYLTEAILLDYLTYSNNAFKKVNKKVSNTLTFWENGLIKDLKISLANEILLTKNFCNYYEITDDKIMNSIQNTVHGLARCTTTQLHTKFRKAKKVAKQLLSAI